MKDVEIKYWGKTPLTNQDLYTLNIVKEDGTKIPVYQNNNIMGYKPLMCDLETANEMRLSLLLEKK